jgi:hypothetical protein
MAAQFVCSCGCAFEYVWCPTGRRFSLPVIRTYLAWFAILLAAGWIGSCCQLAGEACCYSFLWVAACSHGFCHVSLFLLIHGPWFLGVLDCWPYSRWRLLQDVRCMAVMRLSSFGHVWSPAAKDSYACLGEALSPNVWPSPLSPLAGSGRLIWAS